MNSDILLKIEKLSILYDKGILTEKEFIDKKQLLLKEFSLYSKSKNEKNIQTYWLPIPSMILGIIALLACLDDSIWDRDTTVGFFTFVIVSVTLGVVSLYIRNIGKGMSIIGIIVSFFSVLIYIGSI